MIIGSLQDLRPGDIGLGPIGGLTGIGVGLGQWALGEGWSIPAAEDSDRRIKIRHACIVTEGLHDEPPSSEWPTGVINKGSIVQAMPGGAEVAPLKIEHWTSSWAWVRLPEDYPGQGRDAALIAMAMAEADIPYSPLSYAYLAQWRIGFDTARTLAWINRRRHAQMIPGMVNERTGLAGVALPCEAICSVLVDQAWTLTGKRIMLGVPRQCATPAGLAHRLRYETPGAIWGFPGK